jgi:hypothetical protein
MAVAVVDLGSAAFKNAKQASLFNSLQGIKQKTFFELCKYVLENAVVENVLGKCPSYVPDFF